MDGNGGSPPQHVSIIRMEGSACHFDAKDDRAQGYMPD